MATGPTASGPEEQPPTSTEAHQGALSFGGQNLLGVPPFDGYAVKSSFAPVVAPFSGSPLVPEDEPAVLGPAQAGDKDHSNSDQLAGRPHWAGTTRRGTLGCGATSSTA